LVATPSAFVATLLSFPSQAAFVENEMPTGIKELQPIPANPPRWKPSTDPASINVGGLDTTASVNDQIDQIDQLITLKLQVHVFDGF
jgi:hypothetical protein